MSTDLSPQPSLYGLLAEFKGPEELIAASRAVRDKGYLQIEAYTPFPVEALDDALRTKRTRLPYIVFVGGLVGGLSGLAMQTIASVFHYPMNVGGRPFFSWPSFIPITYELTILCSAATAVISMLILNGLPMPYHPLFNIRDFEKVSREGFFLCIEASDPQFRLEEARAALQAQNPVAVHEVPA